MAQRQIRAYQGNARAEDVTCTVAVSDSTIVNYLLNKFSNLDKACRILTYCVRLFKNPQGRKRSIEVSPLEISNSLNIMCKAVQMQSFPNEYKDLSEGVVR